MERGFKDLDKGHGRALSGGSQFVGLQSLHRLSTSRLSNPRMTSWVIIPAYNAAAFIERTLASVAAQTVDDWRAVVVDDGSADRTRFLAEQVARQDPRVLVVSQANNGVAAARNRGASEALADPSCESLLFLDADDALTENALMWLRHGLTSDASASAAHGLAAYVDEFDRPLHPGRCEASGRRRRVPRWIWVRTLRRTEPTTFQSLVCVHALPTPGVVLIRRAAFERTDGYDLETSETSDWAMAVSLARYGPITFVDEVVLSYRQHATNLSNNRHTMKEATQRAWKRAWESPNNTSAQRKAVGRGYRSLHTYMGVMKIQGFLRNWSSPRVAAFEAAYGLKHFGRAIKGHP